MEDSDRGNLPAIESLLNACRGKRVWGAVLSVAWLSLEFGESWFDTEDKIERGEYGLFVGCSWEVMQDGKVQLSSSDSRTEEYCKKVTAHLEGLRIASHEFSSHDHMLRLQFDRQLELIVQPQSGASSLDRWSIFFRDPSAQFHWVTLNGREVTYDR